MNMKISAIVLTSALVGMPVQAADKLVSLAKDNPVMAAIGAVAVLGGAGASAVYAHNSVRVEKAEEKRPVQVPLSPRSKKQQALREKRANLALELDARTKQIDAQITQLDKERDTERKTKAQAEEEAALAEQRKANVAAVAKGDARGIRILGAKFVKDGALNFDAWDELEARMNGLEERHEELSKSLAQANGRAYSAREAAREATAEAQRIADKLAKSQESAAISADAARNANTTNAQLRTELAAARAAATPAPVAAVPPVPPVPAAAPATGVIVHARVEAIQGAGAGTATPAPAAANA